MTKNITKATKTIIVFVITAFSLLCTQNLVMAEGTKEIWPTGNATNDRTVLHFYQGTPKYKFATYAANTDQRLYIHINTIGEIMSFGFHQQAPTANALFWRLRKPDGTYATPGAVAPAGVAVRNNAGAGWIANWAEANAGPESVAGVTVAAGYTPLQVTADQTGDWWIEFNVDQATNVDSVRNAAANSDVLDFWDITVCDAAKATKYTGRLWSKEMTLFAKQAGGTDPTNGFGGSIYFYTTDSVVNKLSFATGFRPLLFYVHANATGPANTGNINNDRRSLRAKKSYAQYKEFLNQPDATAYPMGQLPGISVNPNFEGCNTTGYEIEVTVSHSGKNIVYLDLNGDLVYTASSADVLLSTNAAPGKNIIVWNGLDGFGAPVPSGTSIKIFYEYYGGIVHFPVFDAERNTGGVIFTLIGPTSGAVATKVYYDDSLIPNCAGLPAGCSTVASGGVDGGTATHIWNQSATDSTGANTGFGNLRTMNTWVETQYATSQTVAIATANCPVATVNAGKCVTAYANGDQLATVSDADGGVTNLTLKAGTMCLGTGFSTSGALGTIVVTDASQLVAGTYTVTVTAKDGQSGMASVPISYTIYPAVVAGTVATSGTTTFCVSGDASVINSATLPTGGDASYAYQWQTSTDGSSYADIASETATTYDPPAFTPVATTTYYYRRKETSASCTVYSNVVTIVVNIAPTVSAGSNQTINNTQSVGIGGSPTASGGSGSYTSYAWLPVTGLNDATIANPTASPTITTVYTVTVTDSRGCTNTSSMTVTVNPTANIAVSKTISAGPYYNGQNLTFTITATNNGPNNATGLQITDLLPAGFTYVSSVPSGSTTYNSGTGVWNIGALANAASENITITAKPNTASTLSNTASVTAANEFDNDNTNNSSTVSGINVQKATDLSLTKTVSAAPYYNGQNVTYTLVATNSGPDNATGVTVTDLLPAGLTYVSSSTASGTYNSGTGAWSIGALTATGTATLTITAKPNTTGLITNSASITGTEFDPTTGPANSTSVGITVNAASDLAITKTATGPYRNGQNYTYTITVTNNGPDAASGVSVNEALPAGLVFVAAAPSTGAYNNGTGIWTVGALANAASANITVTVTPTITGTISNTATASATEFDPTSPTTATATVTVDPTTDLSLTKTVSASPYYNGQNVTYTLVATNSGPDNATGVTVTDLLPAGLTYVSSSTVSGAYNNVTGIWTIGNLTASGTATLTITATPNTTGLITNSASITGTEFDPTTGAANAASVGITVSPASDLSVTKTASGSPYYNGQNYTYTITVTNNGPDAATGVSVNEALPAGLVFVASAPSTGAYNNGTGIWTVGGLAKNASASITVTVTPTITGVINNTATASATEQDLVSANSTATATVTINKTADLSITKTAAGSPYYNGQNYTYTITVSNAGPDDATGVNINETLPAGLVFVASAPSTGSYNSGTGIWTVGTLAKSASANITVTVTPTITGVINNTASVSATETDLVSANSTATATVTINKASDLSITKTASAGPYYNGQNLTYTIGVTNNGPDNATGVSINEALPAGLVFVASAPSTGSYNSGTGIWTLGALAKNASASITVTVTPTTTGVINNTASVSATETDLVSGNSTATATINVAAASDLSITKTASAGPYYNGQNLTYTINVTNNGPDAATGVSVNEALPAGLLFVASAPSTGSYNSGTGIWTVGALANSASASITVTVTPTTTGVINNTASVSGTEQDLVSANSTATATINVGASTDLSVTKTISAGPYYNGQPVTFTIVAANNGPDNATAVSVADVVTPNTILNFVSSSTVTGAYNGVTGIWTIGNLSAGSTATLTITVTPTIAGTFVNTATIIGSEFDPANPNNTSSTPTITVDANSDLLTTKTADVTAVNNGQNIVYTITTKNNGPDNATGVVVTESLPAGILFVASNPSVGTYNSGTGIWSVGNLNNNVTATLTLTFTATATGTITNTVTSTATETDLIGGNNTASDDVVVNPTSNLSITKTIDGGPSYSLNQAVTYTIIATNNGPDAATAVVVNDLLPASLTFVSATPSGGTYNNGTGVWNIGNLNSSVSATLTINATLNSTGSVSNTATINDAGGNFDNDNTNNSATSTITVGNAADLSITKTVSAGPYYNGQNLVYTITVDNAGPDAATGLTVNEALPAGLSFVASNPSVGTYNSGTGVWTLGGLAKNASASITVTVTPTISGTIVNNASVSATETDNVAANNTASASITVGASTNLSITKTSSAPSINNGESISYTIVVNNAGPDNATGVQVNETFPGGLTFTSSSATLGTYNSGTAVWSVGNLSANSSATLTIDATANTAGTYTNSVSVTGGEYDPDAGNNSASVNTTINKTADVSVVKVLTTSGPYNVSQTVNFLITASNAGPDGATGVSITDLIPAGLTISGTPTVSQGSYNSGTGVWTVGSIANAGSATLSINATITSATLITNTATISAANEFDNNNANNTSSASVSAGTTADLNVNKTASTGPFANGDNVTFTIVASNAGPDNASAVLVKDILNASNFTFVSASATNGTYSSVTGDWTIGALSNGGSETLTLVAKIINTGTLANTATISGGDYDPSNTGNTSSVNVTVGATADLAVTKTVSNGPYRNGQNLTYTITVNSNGPNNATGVKISDLLPASLSYISSSTGNGAYNQVTGEWIIGNMNNGDVAILTVVAKIVNSGVINNTATVSSDMNDNDATNNSSTSSINATPTADLSAIKTVSAGPYNNGQNVAYTIVASNAGPDNGTGVQLTDILPTGLSYVSSSTATGSYSNVTGLLNIGTLNAGATATLIITAKITGNGSIANTASINGTNYDNDPTNNGSTSTINVGTSADLSIIKSVPAGSYNNGDTVSYTITINNNGANDATGAYATDVLPSSLSYVSASATLGSYNSGTGIWSVGALSNGAFATLTLKAKIVNSGNITNTATVSGADFDANTSNNTSSASISALPSADIDVAKTVSAGPYNVATVVTYTIIAKGKGPDDATGVVVNDVLPAQLTYISSSATKGTYNDATGDWTIGGLANGATETLTITASIASAGTIINTATITGNENDPKTGDNTSTSTIGVGTTADLSVSKTSNAGPFYNGDNITYTIVVANNGPNDAGGVIATDLLPSSLTFVSATPSNGTYNSSNGQWNIGTVINGNVETLIITAKINTVGNINNTATVAGNDYDPTTANNTSTSSNNAGLAADLSVIKNISAGPYYNGDNVTYTITAANAGPNTATSVSVNDLLPAGLSFVSATPNVGSYNAGTGVWSIGTLTSGNNATLAIVAKITAAGNIDNTATIAGTEYDPSAANNTSTSSISALPASDITMLKTVSAGPYNVTGTVQYTVKITNNGPDAATGVSVNDLLPAGLSFTSSSQTTGLYNNATGVWSIGTLNNGQTHTLTINAVINSNGLIVNTATGALNEHDPDATNNTSSASIGVGTTADLSVQKTVSAGPYYNGNNVTYTITATNNGPNDATGVNVNDLLPSQLQFVNATATAGSSYNSLTGVWTIGTLTNAATSSLVITAKINSAATITNTATISGNDFDTDASNNSSSAIFTALPTANLAVVKTASAGPYNINGNVVYTINISNNGPDAATDVIVNDLLPSANLQFVGANTFGSGTYDNNTGVWTVGTLNNAGNAILQITAKIISNGTINNTATITSDEFDNNGSNNTSTSTIGVGTSADLVMDKTIVSAVYNNGQNGTYILTVTNNGPSNATGVSVADQLPAGMNFVSSAASVGSYDNISGLWTIGTLSNAAVATLTITVQFTAPGTVANTATVTGNDYDPTPANNTSTKSIFVNATANLGVNKTAVAGLYTTGGQVTFNIDISNAGPDVAGGVKVTDLLPSGLDYYSATTTRGSYDTISGVWTIGTINVGATEQLTLVADITGSGSISNTASISGDDYDNDPKDNNSTKTINVGTQADLSVTKTASGTNFKVGDVVTFNITANNNGPNASSGITVSEKIPSSLTFISGNASKGSYDVNSGVWTVGSLGNGNQAFLTITAQIKQSGSIINSVKIASNDYDPDASNDTSWVAINVIPQVNLNITKTAINKPYYNGHTIDYTITVGNTGSDDATGVIVTDLLPAGLVYIGDVHSTGVYNPASGIWNIGTLPKGNIKETIVISAKIISATSISNVANIDANEVDIDTTNNTTPPVVINAMTNADVVSSKIIQTAGPYQTGMNVTYVIKATNNGPDDATNVIVSENLPALLTMQGTPTANKGSYNTTTNRWTIGTMANGETDSLILVAQINGTGFISNQIFTNHSEHDDSTANDTATVVINNGVPTVDLSITNTPSVANALPGQDVSFTIVATNNGPDDASSVLVICPIPPSMQFISASSGSFNSANGQWTIGGLSKGNNKILTLVAKVLSNGQIKMPADVAAKEVEVNNANNTDTAIVMADALTDLVVKISAPTQTYYNGDNVVYTVTASNTGPNDATGVNVNVPNISGLSFVSSNPTTGTFNSASGRWSVGNLAAGVTEVLTLTNTITITQVFKRIADISGNETESTISNNADTAVINTLPSADVSILKTVSAGPYQTGDTITYTINVSNIGPDVASNLDISEVLPGTLTYISSSVTMGNPYDVGAGKWTIPSLNSNASAFLVIKARIENVGSITNSVSVAHSEHDVNTSNNTSAVTIQNNVAFVDLFVDKSVSPSGSYYRNQQITYNLSVINKGLDPATNVTLTDLLPSGVTYIGDNSLGAYNSTTGVWTIGTLNPSTLPVTLSINVVINATGQIINTATVSATETDANSLDNADSVAIDVTKVANLSIVKTALPGSYQVNTNVTYKIKVVNSGPDTAKAVLVTDQLPTGLDFISASVSQGMAYNSTTGIWDVGSIVTGDSAIMYIVAKVKFIGTISNTASVKESSAIIDEDASNDQSSAVITTGNLPPVAVNECAKTSKDRKIEIDILKNDFDPDGQLDINSVEIIGFKYSLGQKVVFDVVTHMLTYTPAPGYIGPDTIYYVVSDMLDAKSNQASICVDVIDDFFIPTGFTPNSDGSNDTWTIVGIDLYPDNEVVIFNRWGDEVYKTKAYGQGNNAWDGSDLPAGTYYYVIKYRDREGEMIVTTGYVTLIR